MGRLDRLVDATSARLERAPRDAVVAAVVGAVQVTLALTLFHQSPGRDPVDPSAIGLLLAGSAALALRSRAPVATLAATGTLTIAYLTLDYPGGAALIAPCIAFVSAVVAGRRAAAWAALALTAGGIIYLPGLIEDHPAPTLSKLVGIAVWLCLLVAGSEILRARIERNRDQELARRRQAETVAGQERLRIARELHDLLAHNVSLINVQAGSALHLIDQQPERARPALESIKHASSETLGEMRSVLSILRSPGEQSPRSPTAGVDDVGELAGRTSAAGVPVETEVHGEPRALPASVDLAVYRIVQEALTNVVRHARPSGAVVRLSYGEDRITVEVDDDGPPGAAELNGGGNGIAGMRERAAALGGEFSAGPRPGGGFRVRANLPLAADR